MKRTLLSLILAAGFAANAQATVFMSTDVPVNIPDATDYPGFPNYVPGTVATSSITVTSHFVITDLNVLLSNLEHTFDGDLLISLVGPTGLEIILSDENGLGANFTNTVFDDGAPDSVINGSAPFIGSYSPEELLSWFNGTDAYGTWTLKIQDMYELDTGTLRSWGLEFETPVVGGGGQGVPEPATLGLLGLGLLGLAASRRRKSV